MNIVVIHLQREQPLRGIVVMYVCSKRAYKALKRAETINTSIVEIKKVKKKPLEDLKQENFSRLPKFQN